LRRSLVFALLAGLALITAGPATAGSGHGGGHGDRWGHGHKHPGTIALPTGWQPEGIAIKGSSVYVGSIPTGAVWKGDVHSGQGDTFVPPHPGRAAIGIEVDHHGRLWVAGGGTGQAYVYDARTGADVAAWQLAVAGAEVTLLERGALASGATSKSQGLVLPPDHAELVPLWQESVALYGALADRRDFGFDRAPIGTLLLATSEEQQAALDAVSHAGERLDAAGVAEAEPGLAPGMAGGLLIEEGRRTDPGALAASAAAEARDAGADIRAHVEVKRLVRGGVVTDAGAIEARMVLLAAGAWSRALARMAGHELPVRPVRGWIALVAPGPPVLRHAVYEAEYTAPEPPVPGGPVTLADLAEGTVAEAGPPPVHALGIRPEVVMLAGLELASVELATRAEAALEGHLLELPLDALAGPDAVRDLLVAFGRARGAGLIAAALLRALVVDRNGDLLPPGRGGFERRFRGCGGRGRSGSGSRGRGRGHQRGKESKHSKLSFVPALCPLGVKPIWPGSGSKGLDSLNSWGRRSWV